MNADGDLIIIYKAYYLFQGCFTFQETGLDKPKMR